MASAMGYRVYVGVKDDVGDKIYMAKEDGSADFTKEELVDYLCEKLAFIPEKVRQRHWHLTAEKDGKPVSDEDIDYFLEMYNVTEAEVEAERIRRLKQLHLEKMALKDTIKNHTMWISENMDMPWNVNYFLPGYSYAKEVRQAMKKVSVCGAIPYFAIVDHMRDGSLWISVLYISLHKEDWPYERVSPNGMVSSGVYNTALDDVDFGTIQIRCGLAGSVKRYA